MKNKKSSVSSTRWEDIILENHEKYITMKLPDEHAGYLRHFLLAPGIHLSFVHIHTDSWPVPPQDTSNHVLLLNYCINGRCEVALNNEKFAYLSGQQFAIAMQQLTKPCLYPNCFYKGIEVFLDLSILEEFPYPIFTELGIRPSDLCERFHLTDSFCLLFLPESMKDLLSRLWFLGDTEDINAMKLLLADFIFQLSRQNYQKNLHIQYFTPSQVNIAKKVCAILTSDLSVDYTAKELAHRYGIGETSLKTYFKGVYGENISAYMRKERMSYAAELLEDTRLKVSEIAMQVGYDNQSKFAAVFKKEFGISPLEYRRSKKLSEL